MADGIDAVPTKKRGNVGSDLSRPAKLRFLTILTHLASVAAGFVRIYRASGYRYPGGVDAARETNYDIAAVMPGLTRRE